MYIYNMSNIYIICSVFISEASNATEKEKKASKSKS